jgi:hypothetical protein
MPFALVISGGSGKATSTNGSIGTAQQLRSCVEQFPTAGDALAGTSCLERIRFRYFAEGILTG